MLRAPAGLVVVALALTAGSPAVGAGPGRPVAGAEPALATVAPPSPGSLYRPVDPRRVLSFAAAGPGETVSLQIPGLPAEATAVQLNVTATGATAASFVSACAGGTPVEECRRTSTLNPEPGLDTPSSVLVALGGPSRDTVTLYNNAGTLWLIADLQGYYVPAGAGATGSVVVPRAPTRVLSFQQVGPGQTHVLTLPEVPAGATAVAMNVTSTSASTPTFVSACPTGQPVADCRSVSTLNPTPGLDLPNHVVVKLGGPGRDQVTLYNNAGTVALLVDVTGYYVDSGVGAGGAGGAVATTPPVRLLSFLRMAGATTHVLTVPDVPTGGTAVVLTLTGAATTTTTFVSACPGGTPLDACTRSSVLNPRPGSDVANTVLVPLGGPRGDQVLLYNNAGAVSLIADLRGFVVAAGARPTAPAAPTASPTPQVTMAPSPTPTVTMAPSPTPTVTVAPSPTPTVVPAPTAGTGVPTAEPAAVTPGTGSTPAAPTGTSSTEPPSQPLTASQLLTPADGMLFGAFAGNRGVPDTATAMRELESAVGRKLDLHRWYALWDDVMPPVQVVGSVERGRTPVLSVEPRRVDGAKVSWGSIARGEHDAQIRAHAAGIAGLGVPLFVVFHHEPDFAVGHGDAGEYRAAFRRYVEVFRAAGVSNVAWAWVLTPAAFSSPPTTPSGVGADDLYPGDDVVDWAGLDPYNWFGCAVNVPSRWRTMAEIAGPFRAWGQVRGKPLMLAEWGSFEDGGDPARKGDWYRQTMTTLASWPEIKAVAAFNTTGNCDWWVTSSPTSLAGFVDAASGPSAHGRASAYLVPSTVLGPSPLAVTFDASRSTGSGHTTGSGVVRWTLDHGDGTSTQGDGHPPADLTHTYAAGSYVAVLTVVDAAGSTNVDRRTITAAGPPVVTASERNRTAGSVELHGWVATGSIVGQVQIEWGTTTAYGSASPVMDLAAVGGSQHVSVTATNLTSGTTYYWRITATTAAGTRVLERTTQTAGAPTTAWSGTSSRTATSAQPYVGVHPHLAATTATLQWGTTPTLGRVTSAQVTGAWDYEKTLRWTLDGLTPRTTYYVRLVATNAHGTVVGPTWTFTTTSSS